ncbi:MAG: hypothetical protein ACE366_27015 [Bradymonadia bacterium]
MRHNSLAVCAIVALSGALLGGCVDAPDYFYAEKVTDQQFVPLNTTVGVYPDDTVVIDPNNPFRNYGIGAETKWDIEGDGDPVAGFYSWATLLTQIPTGEHQYYAALNMKAIYESGQTADEHIEATRELAIAGFRSLLENFPESVTFDPTGTQAFPLSTPALQALIDLDSSAPGWALVTTPEGFPVAVKVADVPPPAEEDE